MTVGLLSFVALGQKVGQSVLNVNGHPQAFLNLAKGFAQSSNQTNWPSSSVINDDGFPLNSAAMAAHDWNFVPSVFDPSYYGRYYLWWTGTGNINSTTLACIYYSGNGALSNSSTIYAINGLFVGNSGANQPTVDTSGGNNGPLEFAFGTFINSAANNGSGLVRFTSPISGGFNNISTGNNYVFNNLTYNSGAFPAGPNSDGSWTITAVDSTHIDLQGSGSLNPSLIGFNTSGVAGTNSEAIYSIPPSNNPLINISSAQTISSWSNIVWCKKTHYAAAVAGQLASPDYVTAFKALNPRFIRFMDFQAIQGDKSSSYTFRCTPSNFSWGVFHVVPEYFVGNLTNTGAVGNFSDVYTCANPSASPVSGVYVDGEVVNAFLTTAVNAGFTPGLKITGRTGTAPILNTGNAADALLISMFLTGSICPVGTVQTLVFTGGGLGSPRTLHYTTVSGDNSLTNLGANLKTAINADATLLAAGIGVPFSGAANGSTFGINFNNNIGGLGASLLTITGSDATSNVIYNFGTMTNVPNSNPGNGPLSPNNYYSFTYSALLGAWFCSASGPGVNSGPPLEFYADLCNRAGVGCYIQVGVMWSAARITSTVTLLAGLLTKELKIAFSNETWNRGEAEWAPCNGLGNCLGLSSVTNDKSTNGFTGLRVAQISNLAQAAWAAAGRSRSQLHVQLEYWVDKMSIPPAGLDTSQRLEGVDLNPATNATLAAFGYFGATAIPNDPNTGIKFNYSASPRRPVDWADEIGGAPYFAGAQWNCTGSNLDGSNCAFLTTDFQGVGITITSYNTVLLAAYNYAYGTPTQQATALDALYNENGGTPNGDFYNGLLHATQNFDTTLSTWEINSSNAIGRGVFGVGPTISGYNSTRPDAVRTKLGYCPYEGDFNFSPLTATDIANLAGSMTGLGYTNGYSSGLVGAASGGPTGSSDTATLAATNMANLLIVFLNDDRYRLLTLKYLLIQQRAGQWTGTGTTLDPTVIALGTRFGFEGLSPFSLYSGSVLTTPFKAWQGYQQWNN